MCRFAVLILALLFAMSGSPASASPYQAGSLRTSIEDVPPIETIVWYPTSAAEESWTAGPFTMQTARGAPIAADQRFPVVLLSHGGGGSPMAHRELAAYLAREGIIVVAPAYPGDVRGAHPSANPLRDRVFQSRRVLQAILADARFAAHANPERVGVVGTSLGGTTALLLAGARPDIAGFARYCLAHPEDHGACDRSGGRGPGRPDWEQPSAISFSAMVLLDPMTALFAPDSLATIHCPTLLFRPADDSYQSSTGNALTLAAALPRQPLQFVVPGGHFVFIDPCPPDLMRDAPRICTDPPGVDRAAVHQMLYREISRFLREHL